MTTFTPRDYQVGAIEAGVKHLMHGTGNNFAVLPTGCHAKDTEILMSDLTTKAVQDIRVGDTVMGPDGSPRTVLKLHRGNEPMYRITPLTGGDPFEVNEGHIMALERTREGKPVPSSSKGGERDYLMVGEYLGKPKYWKRLRKLFRSSGITESHCELPRPIDPWMMGVLLGDGSMVNSSVSICTPDDEIVSGIYRFASEWGCAVRVSAKPNNKAKSYNFTTTGTNATGKERNPIINILRSIGAYGHVCENKSVPDAYKRAGAYVRREVLAGLLDTDGYHDGKGGYDFISKSKTLAMDVAFIARSLGITANFRECVKGCQTGATGTYFRVGLSGHTEQIPCRVERKKPAARKQKKNPLRSGFSIEPIGNGDFYGFTLDGDHLYLTADFTVHHNSGKSLVIAGIADRLDGEVLVLQPSKEILYQNAAKMRSFGKHPAIFSASAGRKQIDHITFATIGSVVNRMEAFMRFKHIIVDECHLVPETEGSMYRNFFDRWEEHRNEKLRLFGLTATPFRLGTNSFGSQIKFLGRSSPKIWDKMIYCVQIKDIQSRGYLAKMEYFRHRGIDPAMLRLNSSGSDYTDASIKAAFQASDMEAKIVNIVERLLSGEKSPARKSVLVFTKFVEEAANVAKYIPGAAMVSGETPQSERDRILEDFKAGRIKVVCNVGVLTTGFDFPALDTIVLARPTMSLSLYYQMVGRAIRPHPSKETAWVIDMVNLVNTFGPVEDLLIDTDFKGLPRMTGAIPDKRTGGYIRKQLTNTILAPKQQNSFAGRW